MASTRLLRQLHLLQNEGAIALGAYAKFAMSPKMTLNGEIGIFKATDEPEGFSDDYGTELGVGKL